MQNIESVILNNINSAVYAKDMAMNIIFMNGYCEKLTGISKQEACNLKCYEVFGNDICRNGGICQAEKSLKPVYADNSNLKTSEGSVKTVCRFAGSLINNGRVEGVIVYADEINEKNSPACPIEVSLQAEELNIIKKQFIENISHEIRTPMNNIVGFSDMFYQTSLNSEQKRLVKYIKTSAESLFSTITDLLDYSKIESGGITFENYEFNVKKLILESVNTMMERAAEKKLKLFYSIDPALKFNVMGDETKIQNVILSLIDNAVKFSEKGSICVKASVVSETESNLMVRFEIADEGIGISAENIEKIFLPFYQLDSSTTRKNRGIGLGLPKALGYVRLMGAQDIRVESEAGLGSKFSFELYLARCEANETVKINREPVASKLMLAGCYKVLVVEDNYLNTELLSKSLKIWHCDVKIAENGGAALELVAREKFDVILMDIQMPDMDGFETTRKIRAIGCDTPIIAVTAYVSPGDRISCLSCGMNDYITKPVNITALISSMKACVEDRKKLTAAEI